MALKTAGKFLQKNYNLRLDIPDTIVCDFTEFNRECKEDACPFHDRQAAGNKTESILSL
jgi:hypothetical protein